jgi:hypothetical protein
MNVDNNIKEILLEERTTGEKLNVNVDEVVPRHLKNLDVQQSRTKERAEVFTPVEVVKRMNDMFDEEYIGSDEEYIGRKVLEVTCGEAPYLTTIYDASSGENIPINRRVGLLDRKLQRITTDDEKEWCRLAEIALKSTYGYEWQEDSLFLARMNVLSAVVESFTTKFGKDPTEVKKWAEIVSYNLFRMDGVSMCLPETEIPAKVMNWDKEEMERFDGKIDDITLW